MKKDADILAQIKKTLVATYTRVVGIALASTVVSGAVIVSATIGVFYLLNTQIALNISEISSFFSADYSEHGIRNFTGSILDIIPPSTALLLVISAFVVFVVLLFITFITATSITAMLINNLSFAEAIKFGITKGLRSIPTQILVILLMLLVSAPSLLFALLALIFFSNTLLIFGLFLFLLPIILFVRCTFVLFIWMENQTEKAWLLIKKSFTLTKRSIGWMIVLLIITVNIGGGIVESLFTAILPIHRVDLETIISQIVPIFLITPLLYAGLYVIYKHAKKQIGITKKMKA